VAEFGPDVFGVHRASYVFFKKRPDKINAAEGAFLALMLPSPRRNYLSIYKNKYLSKKNKRKLSRILRDMLFT
jgi:monofunctional biosynthetic peptidoglycan transglycosylase